MRRGWVEVCVWECPTVSDRTRERASISPLAVILERGGVSVGGEEVRR